MRLQRFGRDARTTGKGRACGYERGRPADLTLAPERSALVFGLVRMKSPYRTAPHTTKPQRIVLKRTRTWPLLFCVPLLVSLRVHLITTVNDSSTPSAFVDHDGWLVLVVGRAVSSGYPDVATFTNEPPEPVHPRTVWQHDMTPVRSVLGLIALVAVALYVRDRRVKGTEVVIDRQNRVIRVVTPRGSRHMAFHDRPLLVMRDDDVFLHAGKDTPILLARAKEHLASQVEGLRCALGALD